MKYRFLLLFLLAVTIGGFGWHNAGRLSKARAREQEVIKEARRLEIPSAQSNGVARKSQQRRNPAPIGKLLTPDDVAFMNELEAAEKNSGPTVPNFRERYNAMAERFKSMTPAQARKYVAELRAHEDLTTVTRAKLVEILIRSLSDPNLPTAIDLYVQSIDLLPKNENHTQLGRMIMKWAETDIAAALAWTRGSIPEHTDLINYEARCSIIRGIAQSDRKLAFQLIDELEIDPPSNATQLIVGTAKTSEERISALADLREYLPTIENKNDRAMAKDYALAVLGKNLAKEGFESAVAWVTTAELTDSEIAGFGSDISNFIKEGEREKWIDWFAERLAGGPYQLPIRRIMMSWASRDVDAATRWLNAAPASPAKNYAVSVFAAEVASHQPEAAIEWAITLPAGVERDETLHKIYHNWPTKDPDGKAAAAAFEKEYNIQHHH